MTEMKMVTPEQYAEKLGRHKDDEYHLVLTGSQVPILHGLIALAADHPGVKKLDWPTKRLIAQVRWWCRQKFGEWGFTPEEVEYLDKIREEVKEEQVKTIHLTGVTVKPNDSVEIELEDGYERYLVFYPDSSYLNIDFLDAELCERMTDPSRDSIRCQNTDTSFSHEIWIAQFNHPLPPIFNMWPWQILVAGICGPWEAKEKIQQ